MKSSSVLVYLPGYPFSIQALTPSPLLASCAASLLEEGHETRILDIATLDNIHRLGRQSESSSWFLSSNFSIPDSLESSVYSVIALLCGRKILRNYRRRLAELVKEFAEQIVANKGLHFVAFMLNNVEDMIGSRALAGQIRYRKPELGCVAFGPLVDRFQASILRTAPEFDALCLADAELSLSRLAARPKDFTAWPHIPGVLTRRSGSSRSQCEARFSSFNAMPAPIYHPHIYPALEGDAKLKLFTIEEARGTVPLGGQRQVCRTGQSHLRTKSVQTVCDEMWRLGTMYGGTAFRFTDAEIPASHVNAVALEIIRRRMRVSYSRRLSLDTVVPAMFPTLRMSGCLAAAYRVDTGSQRLLEDFFGRRISVSNVESILRATRDDGIYTIAEFTYPTPQDDYHTAAETLRLITRANPNAVQIRFPELMPGDPWFESPRRFGFCLHPDRYLDRLVRTARRPGFPEWLSWQAPYAASTLAPVTLLQMRNALAAETRSIGVSSTGDADIAMLLQLAALPGHTRDEMDRLEYDLATANARRVADLVQRFNAVACRPAASQHSADSRTASGS